MTRSVTARRAAGAVLVSASALAAGCGAAAQAGPGNAPVSLPASASPTAPGSPSGATASAASPAAAAAGCVRSALQVKVDTSQGGAAAGSAYYPIDFTNSSHSPCTLFGYPGASFVTRPSGSEIGSSASRNASAAAATVTLPPGGEAHAVLQVVQAGNYPVSDCHPVTTHWLRVYPPGQTEPRYASFTSRTCSARLPAKLGSPITVYPVRDGKGKAGQAP